MRPAAMLTHVVFPLLLVATACADARSTSNPVAPTPVTPVVVRQLTVTARSKGYVDVYSQGYAQLVVNGSVIFAATGGAGGGRGFNVAAFNLTSGTLVQPVRNFDTWGTSASGQAMNALIAHLNAIPAGTLVLVAVGDDAGLSERSSWNERGMQVLEALGSREIRSLAFRGAWCLIAIKGEGRALDERRTNGAEATATATVEFR